MAIKNVLIVLVLAVGVWLIFKQTSTPQADTQTNNAPNTQPSEVTSSPVVFDIQNWQTPPKKPTPFASDAQTTALLATLGDVAISDTGLDFRGNNAVLYRYHNRTAPPLYITQSSELFEIAWYFANPHDKDSDKALSLRYAQTAYALSHQLIGKETTPLFTALLAQKSTTLPTGVIYANCQAQLCQIVFDKGAF